MSLIKKKICLLGAVGVGKTSVVRRFVEDVFDDSYLTTIGVKVSQKKVQTKTSGEILLMIWDVEGFDAPDSTNPNYYIGAAGALVVADLTRPESIDAMEKIIQKFKKTAPRAQLLVLGNKLDLVGESHPGYLRFQEIGQTANHDALFTSAKNGTNIEAGFIKLAELIEKSQ